MTREDVDGTIQHDGIVKSVNTDSIVVSITSSSACSGCHAEGFCNISGKEEKTVNVQGKYNVAAGDIVTVVMKKSMGYKAVVLSYLTPVLLVIISLIALVCLKVRESIAGLVSIAILIPYFFILYLSRNQINKSFTFTIKT